MHYTDFERDLIQANVGALKICGYKTEGFVVTLDSLKSFYDANMALLDLGNRSELFCRERPVYTKYATRFRRFTDSAQMSKTASLPTAAR